MQLSSIYADTNFSATFLLKRLRAQIHVANLGVAESVIIGWANGSATVAEISDALQLAVTNPNDPTIQTRMAGKWAVLWETLRIFVSDTEGAHNANHWDISIGGGKGIPMNEDKGIQPFAFNPKSGSLTTGALVSGLIQYLGVFIGD